MNLEDLNDSPCGYPVYYLSYKDSYIENEY